MTDWDQVTPEQFEKLCHKLMELNKFTDIEWHGNSGGDRGRDIVAYKQEEVLPHTSKRAKWRKNDIELV